MASLDEDEAVGQMSHEDAEEWVREYALALEAKANVDAAAARVAALTAVPPPPPIPESPDAVNSLKFKASRTTKRNAMINMRDYQPVTLTFPALRAEWQARIAARGLSTPWSPEERERVFEKASRYIADRTSRQTTFGMTRTDLYTFAMCMVMMHEQRGFPLRHLEEALVAPLIARNDAAREYVHAHPRFNPFELMTHVNRPLFGPDDEQPETHWPSSFQLDADRVAVVAAEQKIRVVARYRTVSSYFPRDIHVRIVAVEPACYKVAAVGRVISLWGALGEWKGRSGEHIITFSWTHGQNLQTLRNIEQTLVGNPVRMRTHVAAHTDAEEAAVDVDDDENVA